MQAAEIISKIQEIHAKYPVPKNLKRHMTLVAGVSEQIANSFQIPIDAKTLVAAALIHDLGNIIKMKLFDSELINLLDKEDQKNLKQFQEKQKEFIKLYGDNAEEANLLIAKEIEAPHNLIELISPGTITLHNGKAIISADIMRQILLYSDLRVAPQGVVSLNERLNEYAKRYKINENLEKSKHSKI